MSANSKSKEPYRVWLCSTSCCPEAVFERQAVEIRPEPGEKGVRLRKAAALRLAEEILKRFGKRDA